MAVRSDLGRPFCICVKCIIIKRRLPANDKGNRRAKLWQTLSPDTGIPHLDKQLEAVYTLMCISADKQEFAQHFERRFGRQLQLRLEVLKQAPELTS